MRPSSKSISQSDLDSNNLTPEQVLPKDGARKAIFLDRDGTINMEKGYITDPREIKLVPMAGESISTLNHQKVPVIVITNQAAIGKGLLTVEAFEEINEKLWNDLQTVNAFYNALYYCPHDPEAITDCLCRKPKPGLLLQAAKDFHINLSASFMIGDKLTDVIAGHLSGCKTVLLLSGYENKRDKVCLNDYTPKPDFICETLAAAITWIWPQILENSGS